MNPKHLPFIRDDQYGEAGLAPLPWQEKLRIILMTAVVVPFKVLGTICCILFVWSTCKLAAPLPNPLGNKLVTWAGKLGSRLCLLCLGFVRVQWVQLAANKNSTPVLRDSVSIVSNHVSWTDILVHMSRSFPSFVARSGTESLPFIGLVSQKMQCLYVKRENKEAGAPGMAATVKERMLQHAAGTHKDMRPMLLFPEGTTSNGKYLMPFKTGAFLAGTPVQPVIIKYHKNRMLQSWESISAPRQIFLLYCQLFHTVTCYELPVYHPNEEEQQDPVLFAQNVRNYMLKYSKLQDTDATMADKRDYQFDLRRRLGLGNDTAGHSKSSAAAGQQNGNVS